MLTLYSKSKYRGLTLQFFFFVAHMADSESAAGLEGVGMWVGRSGGSANDDARHSLKNAAVAVGGGGKGGGRGLRKGALKGGGGGGKENCDKGGSG